METDQNKRLRDAQKDHFNQIADQYIKIRKSNNSHLYYKKLLWGYVFRKLNLKGKNFKLVEPMCGYAEGYFIIKNYSQIEIKQYYGFDYSENIVNHCKKNLNFLKIDFLDIIEFNTSNLYDVGIIIGGLHHVYKESDKAIYNISKSLKDNAFFINFEPTFELKIIEYIRSKIYKFNKFFDENTEKDFRLDILNNKFKQNNLLLVKNFKVGFLGYILFYNPDVFPIFSKIPRFFVSLLFNIDMFLSKIFILNKISFATISVYKKINK